MEKGGGIRPYDTLATVFLKTGTKGANSYSGISGDKMSRRIANIIYQYKF